MLKKVGLGVLILFILGAGAFVAWGSSPSSPMPEAVNALQSDAQVDVESQSALVFRPANEQPTTGFIYYPGGRVDYRAYAPYARAIAARGYLVVVPSMPLNLAVFDPARAEGIIEQHDEIMHWVVGGHSLGGAMAANFAANHPDQVQGLALFASYPAGSDSLSDRNIPVLSIYASQDGLATVENIKASRPLLPGNAQFVRIDGGNHAQFGWYGEQAGDGEATISRSSQQEQTVAAVVEFLDMVSQ